MATAMTQSMAVRALLREFNSLKKEPVEGFIVKLADEQNLFEWQVAIFGPPDTLYEGGYFKALMKFPEDYPYSPPTIKFMNKLWHPNVYENGELCISILHPPIDDPQSGELPSERWNPTQTVRTILLSVISLLNEPNIGSPANVGASVMYRRWKEGADSEYATVIRRQVEESLHEAQTDNVAIPTTLEEYLVRPLTPLPSVSDDLLDDMDIYHDSDSASTDSEYNVPPSS